jgi:hypothetical protein
MRQNDGPISTPIKAEGGNETSIKTPKSRKRANPPPATPSSKIDLDATTPATGSSLATPTSGRTKRKAAPVSFKIDESEDSSPHDVDFEDLDTMPTLPKKQRVTPLQNPPVTAAEVAAVVKARPEPSAFTAATAFPGASQGSQASQATSHLSPVEQQTTPESENIPTPVNMPAAMPTVPVPVVNNDYSSSYYHYQQPAPQMFKQELIPQQPAYETHPDGLSSLTFNENGVPVNDGHYKEYEFAFDTDMFNDDDDDNDNGEI